jgi:threonine dehydrogenase-like Zn-dependent dehydrogenase
MNAAVVVAPSRIEMAQVPVPEPGEGQVRVRLEGCGVCGSNLAPWEGRPWFKYPFAPGELGHEGWGRVDAIGRNVHGFRENDRVALLSYHAYAEYDVAPQEAVVGLPASLGDKPFPGEPLGCAMNVFRRSDIRPGDSVAIIGIGFLGAILTSLAARAGASVIAISRRPFALELARKLGAAATIPMENHQEIVKRVMELSQGEGCSRVIEAVGRQWPLDLAGELTRARGRLVIAGYHQDGARNVNMQLWNWRGLDVINAHERDSGVYVRGIQEAVEAVSNGRLDPFALYTHSFRLEQLGNALNAMKERPDQFLKALVKL